MPYLLVGYMFLFIDRPFEVWPWLGDLRVERVYMLLTLAVWAVHPGKRWLSNPQHAAYAAFAAAVAAGWAMSPWADAGQPVVEDWFKIVVFYVLLVTSVNDEKALNTVAVGFVAVMGAYLLHSFKEYLGGRHTFRMGIARMIGVDTTLGDPNSFGASIVFVLPFVPAMWRSGIFGTWGRLALAGYGGLSVLCILLTGSRGTFIGLIAFGLIVILGHRKRFLWLALMAAAAPVGFLALPDSLQNRFETIVNPEVGPKNAIESGEGRLLGLETGFELWAANPLTGVGPGAWRPATGSDIESHNLYGQLVGELGTLGLFAFVFMLVAFWLNLRRVAAIRRAYPEWRNDLLLQLPSAVGLSVFLLLFMGNFGHNLFRFSWLWYGGFLIVCRHCLERRLLDLPADYDAKAEAEYDHEEWGELPDGWVPHPAHAGESRPVAGVGLSGAGLR